MTLNSHSSNDMGLRDVFHWWTQTTSKLPAIANDDGIMHVQAGDLIGSPESSPKSIPCDFHRYTVKPRTERTYSSLLTKAINAINDENVLTESKTATEHVSIRPRSIMSTYSLDLTSDGGTTGPSRSDTPSPFSETQRQKHNTRISDASSKVATKAYPASGVNLVGNKSQAISESPQNMPYSCSNIHSCEAANFSRPTTETRSAYHTSLSPPSPPVALPRSDNQPNDPAPKQPRRPTIKFACAGPQIVRVPVRKETMAASLSQVDPDSELFSLNLPSKIQNNPIKVITDFTTKTSYMQPSHSSISNESNEIPGSSQATRFHEFASEEIEEDDWLRQDLGALVSKLTINDTLKKENEIRRLASEAEEEEELEKAEAEEDIDDSDAESDAESENDTEDLDFVYESSDDGNETDNEDGFADSDESDAEDVAFWTPNGGLASGDNVLNFTATGHHRAESNSSMDSLRHLHGTAIVKRRRRSSKDLRPKTIDLPDSTDFVCGTLDEDRPLEEAYLSCLEARKQARHILTPQDIDPSFPTSDDDEKNFDRSTSRTNERQKPHHIGIPIDSVRDDGRLGRSLSRNRILVRHYSPKKGLHSPPPPKQRLRSPPPRKLANISPKRLQPSHTSNSRSQIESSSSESRPITFTSLGAPSRLTITKSLPRKPSPFCQGSCEHHLATLKNYTQKSHDREIHVRGAIDIVKGLEQKRQRRKEKLYTKQHNNRKVKGLTEYKPLPGRGAECMREVGLIMANKAGAQNAYILSA